MSELNKPFLKVSYNDANSFKEKYINYEVEIFGESTKYDDKLVFIENSDQNYYELYAQGIPVNNSNNINKIISVTYSELTTLISNSSLVPGQSYRITDYITTTSTAGTTSAGNQFDLIVFADSTNKLNCKAHAIQHTTESDDYFANSDLSKWEIWYDINNDTDKYDWADSTNGKGVIYRMIDEFRNDVPYDFKNIQFYRSYKLSTNLFSTINSSATGVACYTFSNQLTSTESTDLSLVGYTNSIYNNVIKEYILSNVQYLNNICFFGITCYSNIFGISCSKSTFSYDCYSNIFGINCYDNVFGNDCSYNTFGNNNNNNTFGNYCIHNIFGNDCNANIFGNASSIKSYYRYIIYNNGINFTRLNYTQTASINAFCQNIHINSGIRGTSYSDMKTITIGVIGQNYSIDVYAENSTSITL